MINQLRKMALKTILLGILTFIPTGLMAQSENTLSKNTVVEEKGYRFTLDEASRLKIDLKDPIKYSGAPVFFYVNLENAKWLEAINTSNTIANFPGAVFTKVSDTKLEVKLTNSLNSSIYYIPLLTELTGGEAKVSVDGGGTEISSTPLTVFAVTSDQKPIISTGDVTAVRDEGVVANIKIDEIIKGALVNSSKAADRTITLTLLNPNYEFENDKPVIQTSGGFYNMTTKAVNDTGSGTYDISQITTGYGKLSATQADKGILHIYLPEKTNITAPGRLNITELTVKSKTKELQSGKIEIEVSGPSLEKRIVTVAQIKDYSISVLNKLSSPATIKMGSKGTINFSIKENVVESMVEGKTVQVTLDKGYFAAVKNAGISNLSIGKIKLNKQDITKQLSVSAIQKDGYLTGFSFDVPRSIDKDELNEIQFENVAVYAPSNASGNVKLLVNIVGIKEDDAATVAVIKEVTGLTFEPIRLKVGVKDQKGGRLVITETDKDMIQAGVIELEIEAEAGITFPDKPEVTVVEGDIKLGDVRYDGVKPNMLKIEVLRTSRNASRIEIKNFIVTTDGTVPDGGYMLTVKGSALTPDTGLGALEYKNFMIVGNAPIEVTVPTPVEVPATLSKFVIDSAIYDVNGEKRTMDAKAYLEDGRTMVPLKYVADAVGITGKAINFDKGVITIQSGKKVITLYDGQNTAKVNGEELMISGKVIVKEGRTYVPVAEIARLLDVKVVWNANTKTAVFEK